MSFCPPRGIVGFELPALAHGCWIALLALTACGTEPSGTPATGSSGAPALGGNAFGGSLGGAGSGALSSGGSQILGGSGGSGGNLTGGIPSGGAATGGFVAATGGTSGSAGISVSGGGSLGGSAGGQGGATAGVAGAPIALGGSSGAAGGCPKSATFCTGFEDGSLPPGSAYQPTYQAAEWSNFVALDTTQFREGSHSLMVKPTGSSGYSYRMLSVAAPSPSFWVRLYVRSDVDFGQADHNAFFGASTGNGDQNQGELMEVAEQYCQVVMNLRDDVVVSIGGSMACGQGGVKLAKDTWHCVEGFFDGPNGAVRIFADNVPVIDKMGWTKLNYQSFVFGFLGFHGPSRTMWYDQVAVGPERIGCP